VAPLEKSPRPINGFLGVLTLGCPTNNQVKTLIIGRVSPIMLFVVRALTLPVPTIAPWPRSPAILLSATMQFTLRHTAVMTEYELEIRSEAVTGP